MKYGLSDSDFSFARTEKQWLQLPGLFCPIEYENFNFIF